MALYVELNPNQDIERSPKHFIVQGGTTKPTVASHDGFPEPTIGSTCWDATANIIYKTYDGTNWVVFVTLA